MIKTRRGGEATQIPHTRNHYHTKQIGEMSTDPRNPRKECSPCWKRKTLSETQKEGERDPKPLPFSPSPSFQTDLVEES